MSKVYGVAGESAIRELRESVLSRTHPNYIFPKKKFQKDSLKGASVFLSIIGTHILCFVIFIIAVNVLAVNTTMGALMLLADVILYFYLILNASKKNTGSTDKDVQNYDKTEVPADVAMTEKRIRNDFQMILDGKNPQNTIFNDDEKRWAVGAAGEIITSEIIEDSFDDHSSIMNDIIIRKNGLEVANIDHIFINKNGLIMLDTKMWNGNIRLSQNGSYYYIDKKDSYWDSISTCVWEAEKLPVPPRAIVLVVGGRAGSILRGNAISLNAYIEKYDSTNSITPSKYPIFLVSQEEIAEYLKQFDSTLPQGRTISPEQIMGK